MIEKPMVTYWIIGIVLGWSAGLAPGPLMTLVISETLQHNIKAGVKVALSPMITDLPIILLTLLVLKEIARFHSVLGVISLLGGLVIFYMGWSSFRLKEIEVKTPIENPKSLLKGTVVNLLNPHPYLFWLTVGASTLFSAMKQGISAPIGFILGFYLSLIGSKIMLACLVGKSKSFFSERWYRMSVRFLGVLLCVFALMLFRQGLIMLKII